MFALLLNAVRADLDRQLSWVKAEAKRQAGHVELTIILIGIASLAGLGAVIIGLIALYVWLAAQTTQFVALGGGLLLLALILLALTRIRRHPQFSSPPALQLAQPAALLGISTTSPNSQGLVGGEQAVSLGCWALIHVPSSVARKSCQEAGNNKLRLGLPARRPTRWATSYPLFSVVPRWNGRTSSPKPAKLTNRRRWSCFRARPSRLVGLRKPPWVLFTVRSTRKFISTLASFRTSNAAFGLAMSEAKPVSSHKLM